MTTHLEGEDGVLKRLHGVRVEMIRKENGQLAFEPIPGTEFSEDVDLIFLAMGFTGPEPLPLFAQLGVECDAMGRVKADPTTRETSAPGVFVAGDARRGASLIVWAISSVGSPRSTTCISASTTAGSNCRPFWRFSSSSTSESGHDFL